MQELSHVEGKNIAYANASFELVGKRMEHLQEADPGIKREGVVQPSGEQDALRPSGQPRLLR